MKKLLRYFGPFLEPSPKAKERNSGSIMECFSWASQVTLVGVGSGVVVGKKQGKGALPTFEGRERRVAGPRA
jgi:hypothetical protein